MEWQSIPRSEVRLEIPIDSIRTLPTQAAYVAKSGQASAMVQRNADVIVVTSVCDSIQQQCAYYERLSSTYRTKLEEMQAKQTVVNEKPPDGIGKAIKWFIVGVVAGIVLTILVTLKLKQI